MSVILFSEAEGRLLPREDGRPLCSARFQEEADQWVGKQNLSAPVAVIVGLGAGFHVAAWLNANPASRAIVIDPRPSLVRPFLNANAALADRIEIHVIDSVEGLIDHDVMSEIADGLPPVLLFRPAFGAQGALFEKFFATLTGRNRAGLSYFMGRFGMPADAEISEDGRLLTIRDLGLVVDSAPDHMPHANAVRVLRELVN